MLKKSKYLLHICKSIILKLPSLKDLMKEKSIDKVDGKLT